LNHFHNYSFTDTLTQQYVCNNHWTSHRTSNALVHWICSAMLCYTTAWKTSESCVLGQCYWN